MKVIEVLLIFSLIVVIISSVAIPSIKAFRYQEAFTAVLSLLKSCRILSYYSRCEVIAKDRIVWLNCAGKPKDVFYLKVPVSFHTVCEEGIFNSTPQIIKIGNKKIFVEGRFLKWR